VMEQSHRRQLLKLRAAPPKAEIRPLLSWLGDERDVPDPYYDDNSFVPVYRLIEKGVAALFDEVAATCSSGS
jgi:protein-tyrosine-phosphatase